MAYRPTQLKMKEFRLPMIPGTTCGEEMLRRDYRRKHIVGGRNDCGTHIPGLPADSAPDNESQSAIVTQQFSDKAAGVSKTAEQESSAFSCECQACAKELGGQVCRFYAYYVELVTESPKETFRVRKVKIHYYLEDGTMSVCEEVQPNNGIPYKGTLKRHLVPHPDGSTITLGELRVGDPIAFYGTTYLIYDADVFTRRFFDCRGSPLREALQVPTDAFSSSQGRAPRAHDVPSIAASSALNIMLTPEQVKATQQFLAHDRKVLRCDCTWDDREKLYGQVRFLTLYYFLSDSSIALVEKATQNSGRDPFPNFFRRQRIAIPKDPNGKFDSSSYASVAFKEIKNVDYYTDKDIRIGNVLHLFNRDILIHDYNEYTKEYVATTFGITEYNPIPGAIPPPFVPPGAVHRELTAAELSEHNEKKIHDIRRRRFENSSVKFLASMDNGIYEDEIRRFVVTVFPADNTVSIYEPVIRNSGIVGGKFLHRQQIMHPDGKQPFRPDEFFVGARLLLNSHPFLFLATNDCSLDYMEFNMDNFSRSDINKIVYKIQAMLRSKQTGLADAFANADRSTNKCGLEMPVFLDIMRDLNLDVSEQEILTVLRFFDKNGESYVSYEEVAARILPEGSHLGDEDLPWKEIYDQCIQKETASFVTDPKEAERKRLLSSETNLAASGAKELMELYEQRRELFVRTFRTISDYAPDSLIGEDEFKRCVRAKLEIQTITDDELNALCVKLFPTSFERIPFEEFHRLLKGTSSLSHNFKNIIDKTSQ